MNQLLQKIKFMRTNRVFQYGIWALSTLIPTLISSPDLGITFGIVNNISRTYIEKGSIISEKMRLEGLNRLLILIAIGWFIVGGVILASYTFLGDNGDNSDQLFVALLLALSIFVFGIPTTLWSRVQLAMERGHESLHWEGIGKIVSFIGSLLVLLFFPNLFLLIVMTTLPTVIAAYINANIFRRNTLYTNNLILEKIKSVAETIKDNYSTLNTGAYFLLAQIAYLKCMRINHVKPLQLYF
ncbi:hypothetical protein [Deinococcus arenicola]|uniref:Uncharacterized protein n=1 Tax=Deinococcus arenicola TaxID=2994950 RepID=A0ABU4DSI0_9DEIO|nr:hypothetical protein [Deinococcus sp. ZS9-10]MDV6375391.1 hypothetical protein [Deinococcus sp. ZS9-10]